MKYFTAISPLLCLLLLTGACISGAKTTVRFEKLKYPASMTPHLYGKNGKVLSQGKQLETIEKIKTKKTRWSIFYGLINFGVTYEAGPILNKLIRKAGGLGIVNLTVQNQACLSNYFLSLSLLPIMPGCLRIKITGDVVTLKP